MRWLVMLVLCGGCRQLFGIATPDHLGDAAVTDGDGVAIDGPIDAPIDTPPGSSCYGAGFGRVCFLAPPQGDVTLQQAIDTDSSTLCDTTNAIGASNWCVIAGTTITVKGTVATTGAKPLVLIATNTLAVTGNLDVSTRRNVQTGAGSASGATLCDAGTVGGTSAGGAGGSFGSVGGTGGTNGGIAGQTKPAAMRGGCSGQDGRTGTPGPHGIGGGAVYLIAAAITVGGKINASGGGGSGGVNGNGGGGGGGSGGLIGLDAPTITMNNAVIIANGGGGGEGATNNPGNPGGESNGGVAPGGTGGTGTGGDGGAGAAMSTPGGSGGNGAGGAGGGGGGGGVGVIVLFQAAAISGTGTVSPSPS